MFKVWKEIKEKVEKEKRNLPEYQFKFLYHKVIPGIFFVIFGGILALALNVLFTFIFKSEIIGLIPSIIYFFVTIVLLIFFVIYNKKYSNMLLDDKTKEFDLKYKLIDYDVAALKLKDDNIINEDTIFVNNQTYLLKDLYFFMYSKTLSGVYYFRLNIHKKDNNNFIGYVDLDQNLCSYFSKHIDFIVNSDMFELFLRDRRTFLKYLHKYNDIKKMQKKYIRDNSLVSDKENVIKQYFGFLQNYGFKFTKRDLGNLTDSTGKLLYYGPLNCYYLYNDNLCINFMNLVERDDWSIFITNELSYDQKIINKGKKLEEKYFYNFELLAVAIKDEIEKSNTIFGIHIK